MVRIEVCYLARVNNKNLEIKTNIYGKPFILNVPNIKFNISHAGHYVACAISDKKVGIDIELIKMSDIAIANRFFTENEKKYVISEKNPSRFYEVWTKKESRIKWEGKGLYQSLSSFCVFNPEKRLFYHKAFENKDAICYICSTEREIQSIQMANTSTIIKNALEYL